MELCRIIKADNIKDINFDSLGFHWTTTPEKAYSHIVENGETSFWIYADVDESSIWNDISADDFSEYPSLENNMEKGEFEVTLRPGSIVRNIQVYDDSQEVVFELKTATV